MSIAEATTLIDDLVKAKMPKKTATNLVDYVEKHQSQELKQDVHTLKQDVHTLKHDVHTLKQDVRTLKQDVHISKHDVKWIKWIIGLGFSLMFALLISTMNRIDKTNNRIDKLDAKVDDVRVSLENKIDANHKQIINILLKRK